MTSQRMSETWNRATALHDIRHRLWLCLSSAATVERDLAPIVEDVWQLERRDLQRLTAVHLAIGNQTEVVLRAVERLLRELPSSVTRADQELDGHVRGPVAWER